MRSKTLKLCCVSEKGLKLSQAFPNLKPKLLQVWTAAQTLAAVLDFDHTTVHAHILIHVLMEDLWSYTVLNQISTT
jgi:hypothetical protein